MIGISLLFLLLLTFVRVSFFVALSQPLSAISTLIASKATYATSNKPSNRPKDSIVIQELTSTQQETLHIAQAFCKSCLLLFTAIPSCLINCKAAFGRLMGDEAVVMICCGAHVVVWR